MKNVEVLPSKTNPRSDDSCFGVPIVVVTLLSVGTARECYVVRQLHKQGLTMNRGTWKAWERRLAVMFNGERIPVSGRQTDKHGADVITPIFHIQAKRGYKQPGYLRDWVDGIAFKAREDNKLGVVIWQEKGKADADALVVMNLRDFEDLNGRIT